jgi:hypothetical protein
MIGVLPSKASLVTNPTNTVLGNIELLPYEERQAWASTWRSHFY